MIRFILLGLVLCSYLCAIEPNIILLGPPGSGKGTFSQYAKQYGYDHLSAGDFLRQEVMKQTPTGKQIEVLIRNGDYLDISLFWQIMRQQVTSMHETGRPFILDGFGRSPEDCKELLTLLHDLCTEQPIFVLFLTSSDAICKQRILQRVVCPDCNYVGSQACMSEDGLCPSCNTCILELRCNDTSWIIDKRLNTYHAHIEPSYYTLTEHFPHCFFSTERSLEACFSFYDTLLQSFQ